MCSCNNKINCSIGIKKYLKVLNQRARYIVRLDKEDGDLKSLSDRLSTMRCSTKEELDIIKNYLEDEYQKRDIPW